MLPESSRSSPVLWGLCKLLWNVLRPLDTHALREKRGLAVWQLSCITFLTLLLRSSSNIATVVSVALYSLAKLLYPFLPFFTWGMQVQNRFKTGQCSHGDFSHSDLSSSPSIFRFKTQIANIIENVCYNVSRHETEVCHCNLKCKLQCFFSTWLFSKM